MNYNISYLRGKYHCKVNAKFYKWAKFKAVFRKIKFPFLNDAVLSTNLTNVIVELMKTDTKVGENKGNALR